MAGIIFSDKLLKKKRGGVVVVEREAPGGLHLFVLEKLEMAQAGCTIKMLP